MAQQQKSLIIIIIHIRAMVSVGIIYPTDTMADVNNFVVLREKKIPQFLSMSLYLTDCAKDGLKICNQKTTINIT